MARDRFVPKVLFVILFTPGFSQMMRGAPKLGNRVSGFPQKSSLLAPVKPDVKERKFR